MFRHDKHCYLTYLGHDLDRHMRTHTGEKPYSCDICNAPFGYKSALKSHRRTHTGERPYECELCSKAYAQLANLLSHKRTHYRAKFKELLKEKKEKEKEENIISNESNKKDLTTTGALNYSITAEEFEYFAHKWHKHDFPF